MQNTAGLILAASAGRHSGRPKALVEYAGRTLLDRAVETLRSGGCRQVLAVLGAQAKHVLGAANEPFTPVMNRRWGRGLSTSLRAGLAAVPDRYEAVVVTLVDLPRIEAEAVRRLIDAASGGASLAVATYDGHCGHPLLFAREHFDDIAAASSGDRGARDFLAANAHHVHEVPCPGDASEADAPTDLVELGRPF